MQHAAPSVRGPHHLLWIAAIWLLALAAYSNSFQAGFVFDSQRVILADSRIQADTADNSHQIWTGDYYNGTGSSALYRPLTTFSYRWNYAVLGNGTHAAAYHWVNFLLHALNIALLYGLGWLLFRDVWPAFAMAALWAVHPILTESVTNVVGRADLLAASGVLAGLLCYVRAIDSGDGWRRPAWIAGLAAAGAVAVFSKESGVVLLAVMIVYDVAFAPKLAWQWRAAAYAAVAVPAAIFLMMRSRALGQVSSLLISYGDNPLQQAGWLTSRLTAIKVLGDYLCLLLWPARLSADYSYNQIPLASWTDWRTLAALLVWIAVAAAAWWSYRRARPVFFLIAFFVVTIGPVANLAMLVGSIMAERFLYLPSVGFAGCVVWAALAVHRRVPGRWPVAALAVICLAFAVRTYARNSEWHDERSLWASAVQVCPESYKTHENLATVMLAETPPDIAGATREAERALAILAPLPDDRSMPAVYATAGRCYRARGELAKARAVLERGRNIDRAWNDAFVERNRLDGKAVSSVGTPPLYLDLAGVYRDLGEPEKALEALRYGRAIDPQPAFFEEMSKTYLGMGQSDRAAISLLEGLAVDSHQGSLLSAATELYRETAPGSCALTNTGQAVTLDLSCPLVHTQLCTASHNMVEMFTQMRDPASASAAAQTAVRGYGCPADTFR